MDKRDEAREILLQMRSCVPKSFFNEVGETQRGMGFVLVFLDEAEGDVYAGDIARELGVSTARIAALLNRMEKNGLITRETDAHDARKTVVGITQLGRQWTRRTKEQILDKTELLLEKVGREELREFIGISRKIQKALEDQVLFEK